MKDVVTYRGYIGSVRYSAEDEIFYGKIEAINDLILFEGHSVQEIKKAFHDAVDDYIETCKKMKREPNKPFKGSFNVRISPDLHRKVAEQAARSGMTLNQFVRKAVESAVHGR